jgi:hypothetical protein
MRLLKTLLWELIQLAFFQLARASLSKEVFEQKLDQKNYLCIKYHYTNKSTQNYAVVNVIRKIINPIIISKEKINFGEIDASKNYKTNIDIRIDKSFVKNIIIDESKSLEKVADLKIKTNSLDQCMLSLIFNKHKKIAGTIKGSVKIRADIIKPVKYKYIWDVPVYAFIKSEFQVSPEFLIIPKININEEHEECITIYSTNSFILKSVTDSNSDNLCKFKTSQSSINKSAVNITYLGSDSSGSLSGYLNIEIVLKNNNQTFYFRIPYVKI